MTTPENPTPEQPEDQDASSAEPPNNAQPSPPEQPQQPSPVWNPSGDQDEAPHDHQQQPRFDEAGNPTAHAAVPPPLSGYGQQPNQGQGQAQPQGQWPGGQQWQGQQQDQPTYADNNSHPPGYGRQPPGYGQQQPPPGYDQQPGYSYPPPPPEYGSQYGFPSDRPAGMPPYAGWGQRVVAWLVDNLIAAVGIDLLEASYSDWNTSGRAVSWVITVIGVIWALYNAYQAGQTGQSTGKRMMHIRLARYVDGQVVGGGYGLLRLFMNVVFWVICVIPGLLNYLWPLWDKKSQTWSDKIASSVVVKTQTQ